ncbi:MAG: metalloregulator ArsR/SmtB family transcription factor [Candidatus Thiodiazotropha taylori]|nr:metalloregulator ArsR/SmtB family transcription factor [Candidatus Thiodiazotropha taylori]
MANYIESLDNTFHALSDPTRRAVIARLIVGEASVKELAKPFPMQLPSFMKHIKVLEDSGLIASKKVGRVRTCRIQAAQLALSESWLSDQLKLWQGRTDRLAEYVETLTTKEHRK